MIKVGDDKLPESIQIILNGSNKDGKGGLSLAWSLADSDDRQFIGEMADKIRGFNTSNINRHMILLRSDAAMGNGHTATLLLNKSEQGILFSFYSKNGNAIDDGQMRIAFLDSTQWNDLLYNKGKYNLVASDGTIQSEYYDKNLYLTESASDGKNALSKIAELYNNPGKYNLLTRNCDYMTYYVATAANIFYDKELIPIESFEDTVLYHTNRKLWYMDEMFD